jgi:hypothetical protein
MCHHYLLMHVYTDELLISLKKSFHFTNEEHTVSVFSYS